MPTGRALDKKWESDVIEATKRIKDNIRKTQNKIKQRHIKETIDELIEKVKALKEPYRNNIMGDAMIAMYNSALDDVLHILEAAQEEEQ